MNNSVQQLKKAEERLNRLRQIRDSGAYVGAGLTLTIGIGRDPEDVITLEMGISTNEKLLLDRLIEHQQDVCQYWSDNVRRDFEELQQFMADRRASAEKEVAKVANS